ncbi:MAG: histidine--tRNA ligase [archaeon]
MKFETPRGMRDFLPEDMEKRSYVIEVIRGVFSRYGFREIQTPALEALGLLTAKSGGGDEVSKEIFSLKDQSGRMLGLRFDQTVPTARVVANNNQLPKPFKRFVIGPVWRYERPQAGRYREFWQADVDTFGAEGVEADLEAVACAVDVMLALDFKEFYVDINSRKLVEGISLDYGFKENDVPELLRCIDKLDKIGEDGVIAEMKEKKLDAEQGRNLLNALLAEGKPAEVLKTAKNLAKNDLAKEGIAELEKFFKLAKSYGIDKYLRLNLSLARGLAYYTGMVYEFKAKDAKIGSITAGGRYDKLVSLAGGEDLPATGISIGIDRLVQVIEQAGKLKKSGAIQALVAYFPGCEEKAIELAQELRKAGINTDFDTKARSVSKNLDFANSSGIPYVVLVGEKELKAKKYALKDMKSGKQELLSLEQIIKNLNIVGKK